MTAAATRADEAAEALGAAWAALGGAADGGWSRRLPGVTAAVTGLPVGTFNGIWVTGAEAAPGDVEDLLDRVGSAGVPHCVQVRPGLDPALAGIVRRRGIREAGTVALMVLPDPTALPPAAPDLVVRRLDRDDVGTHVELAGPVFGLPNAVLTGLMRPAMSLPGAACVVGSVEQEDIVTGYGLAQGGSVGVFNVATVPAHRRRGHGAALTAHIVRDAAARGAGWAWLQSSAAGHGVYRRLGFEDLGPWTLYVAG